MRFRFETANSPVMQPSGGVEPPGLAHQPGTTKRPAIPYLASEVTHGGRIAEHIASVVGLGARVADVFSGTATVSANLKGLGMWIVANDNLLWAFHAARAKLLNTDAPTFQGVDVPTDGHDVDRYGAVLQFLNALPPVDGFWVREYSPAGPHGRLYFTMQNAGSIGAIRRQISAWSDCLTPGESSLLITDLCAAASAVANTAARFRTYLRDRFKPNALCPLQLRRADFTRGAPDDIHEVRRGDSNALVRGLDVDAVCADPLTTRGSTLRTITSWKPSRPVTNFRSKGNAGSVPGQSCRRPTVKRVRPLAPWRIWSPTPEVGISSWDTAPAATSATHKYWKFSRCMETSAFFNTIQGVIEVLAWRIKAPGSLSACTTSTEAGAGRIGGSYEVSIPFEVSQAVE